MFKISQLNYQANSAAVFDYFADQPYSVFIDSCGLNRYDIIAAHPRKLIISSDIHTDPFALTKEHLQKMDKEDQHPLAETLPFTIGAIGYFSYDLGFHLLGLSSKSLIDITLPKAVVGIYDWSIIFDHQAKQTYLISKTDMSNSELLKIKNIIANPRSLSRSFSLTSSFQANMSKKQYADAFNQVKQHIRAGDCYQVNLAQRFCASYKGSAWNAYQHLRLQNPMPMAAFMSLPEGAILCLSPERFIQVNNNKIITQPIKGTSPRFADPSMDLQSAQNLLNSEKDRAENIMIVDLLRNDLGKCAQPGSIKVPQLCALESFNNVHHLVSTITAILEADKHPLDLLHQCFPGGSITGAPKRRAVEIIDQLEPHHRSIYCGSLAYCDVRGRLDSNIAIRTLICADNQIYCYGGGGIVHDSLLDNEFQEIQTKISKLLKIIENINSDAKFTYNSQGRWL